MMPFVKRSRIENFCGLVWTGSEFTREEDLAEEYLDLDEAEQVAAQCGGLVIEYQRFDRFGDVPRFPTQYNAIAAE